MATAGAGRSACCAARAAQWWTLSSLDARARAPVRIDTPRRRSVVDAPGW